MSKVLVRLESQAAMYLQDRIAKKKAMTAKSAQTAWPVLSVAAKPGLPSLYIAWSSLGVRRAL
jgi:hypothetical protein